MESRRLARDPLVSHRIRAQAQIRYYLQSPAKDTPECEAVRVLLSQNGIGLEGVAEAYNFAWDYSTWTKRLANAATPSQKAAIELMRQMRYDGAIITFTGKYLINNSALIRSLTKIEPKVFFGTFSFSMLERASEAVKAAAPVEEPSRQKTIRRPNGMKFPPFVNGDQFDRARWSFDPEYRGLIWDFFLQRELERSTTSSGASNIMKLFEAYKLPPTMMPAALRAAYADCSGVQQFKEFAARDRPYVSDWQFHVDQFQQDSEERLKRNTGITNAAFYQVLWNIPIDNSASGISTFVAENEPIRFP